MANSGSLIMLAKLRSVDYVPQTALREWLVRLALGKLSSVDWDCWTTLTRVRPLDCARWTACLGLHSANGDCRLRSLVCAQWALRRALSSADRVLSIAFYTALVSRSRGPTAVLDCTPRSLQLLAALVHRALWSVSNGRFH